MSITANNTGFDHYPTTSEAAAIDVKATTVTSSVSEEVRDSRLREGKCVGCGTQLFEPKRTGWRRTKVVMIPLNIAGQVSRGQCLCSCLPKPQPKQQVKYDAKNKQSIQAREEKPNEEPTEVTLDDEEDGNQEEDQNNLFTAIGHHDSFRNYRVNRLQEEKRCEDEENSSFDAKQQQQQQDAPETFLPSIVNNISIPITSGGSSVFYEGDLNPAGLPHGYGEMVFSDGDRYRGQFMNGKLHGQGTMLFNNGSEYVGSWESGVMQGSGTMRFQNGDTYSGDHQHNKRSGQGRMYFSNGDLYIGAWHNGQIHGLGRYHYRSGHKFEGNFAIGKRHGKGKYQYSDGSILIQKFVNDHRVGEGVKFSANGKSVWLVVDEKRKGRITHSQARAIMLRCDESTRESM